MIGSNTTDIDSFKNYTISFKKPSEMKIINKNNECDYNANYYLFDWNILSYNLFVSSKQYIKP